jgi:uncharacterized protein
MSIELPVISCEGCGRCCDRIGTPPFVYWHPSLYRGEVPASWGDGDPETERWATVPAEAMAILCGYYDGDDLSRSESDLPCLWYDTERRACRFYEHRPEVCREFEMGGESCREFRAEARA